MLKNKTVLLVDFEEAEKKRMIYFFDTVDILVKEATNKDLERGTQFENGEIDFIVLSLGATSKKETFDFLEARQHIELPIIVLDSRDGYGNEVKSLQMGADDYLKKPFQAEVLYARMQAVYRRLKKEESDVLVVGAITISEQFHFVKVENRDVFLSPKEYQIFLILVKMNGKMVTREELLRKVWGYYYYGGLRTVDTHINRLRIKLDKYGNNIHTIRGFGYRFDGTIIS